MSQEADDTTPFTEVRHVFRWDLDKTYLRTDFDSLGSLLRIPFEKARDKVNVPGAAALLRALSNPPAELGPVHVYFISGSPRQMRKVLAAKLKLDGVSYHRLSLKPNLENLARGRFRAIKEQVGYKLPLLLRGRGPYLPDARETLFGDDAESDAFIYSLYADYLAGAVEWDVVEAVMVACGVYADALERARQARERLIRADCVEQIFINLDRRSSPSRFAALNPRIVPIYNYWQAALCLQAQGRLDAAATLSVAEAMLSRFAYTVPRLHNSAEDLLRRGLLDPASLQRAVAELEAAEQPWDVAPLREAMGRLASRPPALDAEGVARAEAQAQPRDYLALLDGERDARRSAKREDLAMRKLRAELAREDDEG